MEERKKKTQKLIAMALESFAADVIDEMALTGEIDAADAGGTAKAAAEAMLRDSAFRSNAIACCMAAVRFAGTKTA